MSGCPTSQQPRVPNRRCRVWSNLGNETDTALAPVEPPSTSANRGRVTGEITKRVEFCKAPRCHGEEWSGLGWRALRRGQQGGLCEGAAFCRKQGPWVETGTLVNNWRDKKFSAGGPGAEGGGRGRRVERGPSGQGREGAPVDPGGLPGGGALLGGQEATVGEKLRMLVWTPRGGGSEPHFRGRMKDLWGRWLWALN